VNIIDRAITSVAPNWGLKRAVARRALGHMSKARARSVSSGDFGRNTGRADDARPARLVDRNKLLNLISTDPFAKRGLNVLVNNTVGWGITGSPKNAPQRFSKLWSDWIRVCDWNGRLDFYGLQELAVRTMFHLGEVFIIRHLVKVDANNPVVPLRLQLLDAGMLATSVSTFEGREVVNGVEYDDDFRAVAYHFVKSRSLKIFSSKTVRVLAADCIHLFVQERVGQRHGVSVFESSIKRFGDIDEAVEAEIMRKNIEACFVGFITPPVDEEATALGSIDQNGEKTVDGFDIENLSPGMLSRLRPGEEISFGDPKASSGLSDIVKLALMSSSAGIGIMYEHLSGDLSNVNFTSYKAGASEFQRSVGRIQFNTIIPVMLDPIVEWFQDTARISGMMQNKSYQMTWMPPPFESVEPLKQATADVLLMEAGLKSRRELLTANGTDYDVFMQQAAEDKQGLKDKKLTFKGDYVPKAQSSPEKVKE
jgi:lambda family phage portal protein